MRARLLLLALLAAGASGAGAVGAAAAPASPPLSVSTALLPNPAFFGDPLVAQVIVSFDPARVKASSIRVSASFAPFSQTSLPASSSGRAGADDLLVFRYPVQCYTESCLPERGVFRVTLPPVIVTAASIPGGTRLSARGRWQPAVVKSRLPAKATGRITPASSGRRASRRRATASRPTSARRSCSRSRSRCSRGRCCSQGASSSG